MKLESEDQLNLSDSIGTFFPQAPADKRDITIEQLLTHCSGLAQRPEEYREVSRESLLDEILRAPLAFPTGSKHDYSNEGYTILAAIVEVRSGRPFRDYVREKLLRPAGLQSTGWQGSELPKLSPNLIAKGYEWYGVEEDLVQRSGSTWYMMGAGAMTSTVRDLYRWMVALKAGKVLPAESVRRMWTPHVSEAGPIKDYGFGWWVTKTGLGLPIIRHSGDGWAFGADVRFYPTEDLLLVSAVNSRHDLFAPIKRVAGVVPMILWQLPVPMPPASEPGDKRVDALKGRYRLPTGGHVVIQTIAGQTQIGAEGLDAMDVLDPVSETERAKRREIDSLSLKVAESAFAGDFGPMESALDPKADRGAFRTTWYAETGKLLSGLAAPIAVRSRGTYEPGWAGMYTTVLELSSGKETRLSGLMWSRNNLLSYTVPKVPPVCGMMAVRSAGRSTLVAWDMKKEKGLRIELRKLNGRTALNISPLDGNIWVLAERV